MHQTTLRRTSALGLFALVGNLLATGCATSPTLDSSNQEVTAATGEPVACDADGDRKLKRRLELRKIKLEADIDTAESTIRVNDKTIAENTATILADTQYIKMVQEGLNFPPTDPALPSAEGRQHLVDAIEDVGKFPATAVVKFGLYTLMAALEAITLRAGGKLIARKLCLQTAVKQAEKLAVAQATKLAGAKALSKLAKFRSTFGRVRVVLQHTGSIAVPMKLKWDQKGDTWETWVPVVGTFKIGLDDVGEAFTKWINADDAKKNLQAQVEMIDEEIKKNQDEIKATAADTAALEKENVKFADDIKKMKTELALVDAALAKLGGGNVCFACDNDGFVVVTLDAGVPTPVTTTPVSTTVVTTLSADATSMTGTLPPPPMMTPPTTPTTIEPDYSTWTIDQLLAGINLDDAPSEGGSADALIRDEFEECDADGVCTPI